MARDAGEGDAAEATEITEDPFGVQRLNAEIGALADALGDIDAQIGWNCVASASTPVLPFSGRFCAHEGTGLPWPSPSQAIGWLLVAFAVTLGAQFWFDLFKRLAHIRTSGITGSLATGQASNPSG